MNQTLPTLEINLTTLSIQQVLNCEKPENLVIKNNSNNYEITESFYLDDTAEVVITKQIEFRTNEIKILKIGKSYYSFEKFKMKENSLIWIDTINSELSQFRLVSIVKYPPLLMVLFEVGMDGGHSFFVPMKDYFRSDGKSQILIEKRYTELQIAQKIIRLTNQFFGV